MPNYLEQSAGSDPRLWDTDDDGITDSDEVRWMYDATNSLIPLRNRSLQINDTTKNSYISILPSSEHGLTNWTIEAWVYPEAGNTGEVEVISRMVTTNAYSYRVGLVWTNNLSGESGYRAFAEFTDAVDGSVNRMYGQSPTNEMLLITANEWTHLAATFGYDADDRHQLRLYVNGTKWAERTDNAFMPATTGVGPIIERIGQGFIGLIDEVRIWNKALEADKINDGQLMRITDRSLFF